MSDKIEQASMPQNILKTRDDHCPVYFEEIEENIFSAQREWSNPRPDQGDGPPQ